MDSVVPDTEMGEGGRSRTDAPTPASSVPPRLYVWTWLDNPLHRHIDIRMVIFNVIPLWVVDDVIAALDGDETVAHFCSPELVPERDTWTHRNVLGGKPHSDDVLSALALRRALAMSEHPAAGVLYDFLRTTSENVYPKAPW